MAEGAAQVEQVIVEHDEHRQQINTKNDERAPNRAANSDAPGTRTLRFNFSQHNTLSGKSRSRDGPVDFAATIVSSARSYFANPQLGARQLMAIPTALTPFPHPDIVCADGRMIQ